MYFWNVKALVKSLKDNSITEFEKMLYLLAYGLLFSFLSIISTLMPETTTPQFYDDWILDVIFLIINAFGILYLYNINSKGDNKDFITRYICLGLPVTIRYFIFSIPYFIAATIILGVSLALISPNERSESGKVLNLILDIGGVVWVTYLFKYASKWVKEVSSHP